MRQAFKICSAIALVMAASSCSTDKGSNTPAPQPVIYTVAQPPMAQPPAPQSPTPIEPPQSPVEAPVTPPPPPQPVPSLPTAQPIPAPVASAVRVVSVNGMQVDGSGVVGVEPGESLLLVADALTLTSTGSQQRENLGVDQFSWTADSNGAFCDRRFGSCNPSACFIVNGNGVIYQVPRELRGDIVLTVRQNGTSFTDTLILRPTERGFRDLHRRNEGPGEGILLPGAPVTPQGWGRRS